LKCSPLKYANWLARKNAADALEAAAAPVAEEQWVEPEAGEFVAKEDGGDNDGDELADDDIDIGEPDLDGACDEERALHPFQKTKKQFYENPNTWTHIHANINTYTHTYTHAHIDIHAHASILLYTFTYTLQGCIAL
jgi:hypothetical protein